MNRIHSGNPLLWLGLLLLAWAVLGVQLATPKVASGPFYAATEHHLGVTRWEAAPRLGLDAWTTKFASGDTVGAKATASTGGQAASTLPKNFGESVLGHNTQVGVRNSKAGTISVAHNNDAFLESVEITGAKVSNKITDARFPGVVEYSYQLSRTNTKGELIGGYKPGRLQELSATRLLN